MKTITEFGVEFAVRQLTLDFTFRFIESINIAFAASGNAPWIPDEKWFEQWSGNIEAYLATGDVKSGLDSKTE